ncbi:diaminopimelate decarboxylase [Brevibacterium sp.]|uniref:diaminopimelate decarboxylase n=1 Tax=Brevibacterium sp. TaxID=1701 RepID=UPI0028128669|nr:diaminopimelate decarboxylase [Brevibacterium sp.]
MTRRESAYRQTAAPREQCAVPPEEPTGAAGEQLDHALARALAISMVARNAGTGSVPALDDTNPVVGLMDLDLLVEQYQRLDSAFAGKHDVLHAVACKAVPLRSLLHLYASIGAGCEVAGPGELELAVAAGFTPERIVFDSPAKTRAELRRAIELGVSMNVDNWEELARLDELLADVGTASARRDTDVGTASARRDTDAGTASARRDADAGTASGTRASGTTSARIGLRVNPQTGSGTIAAMSTATSTSKFGIGITDSGAREELIRAYLERPWLNQIHVHSGSQGIGLDQAAESIAEVVELAREINARAAVRQIARIDIGGGLPVNFASEDITPTFAEYRAALDARVPGLFDFELVTEFGRSLLAKAGTVLSRVEYTKTTGGRLIAITHAGAQVAARTAYAPEDWPLRILPFDRAGRAKSEEDPVPTDVAGPACFAGDLLARDRMLPRLEAGDLVAVPDTGAYYFSNHYSYNLLPRIPIHGYRRLRSESSTEELEFLLIRPGQTVEQVLAEAGEADLVSGSLGS